MQLPLRLLCLVLLAGASAFSLGGRAPVSSTLAAAATRVEPITMGRGDKRTKKGKRKAKSFGNSRPDNAKIRKTKESGERAALYKASLE